MSACLSVVGAKKLADQCANELRTFFRSRFGDDRVLKPLGVPTGFQLAPSAATARAFTEEGKELLVAHLLAQVLGVLKQTFGKIDAGNWCIRVCSPYELNVTAQDARLHIVST